MAYNRRHQHELHLQGYRLKIRFQPPSRPDEAIEVVGVVDTGATYTALVGHLCRKLGLIQTGIRTFAGASGVGEAPLYAVDFSVPAINVVGFGEILGLPADSVGDNVHALIGRDILKLCRMTWDGPAGTVKIENQMTKKKPRKSRRRHKQH